VALALLCKAEPGNGEPVGIFYSTADQKGALGTSPWEALADLQDILEPAVKERKKHQMECAGR